MNKNKFFEKVGKLTFSILMTVILATGIVLAGTTWQTYNNTDIISGSEWQKMVTIINAKFNKSDIPTCANGEVLKADGSTLSCITDNTGGSTDLSSYYTKTQIDTKLTGIGGISSCITRKNVNSHGTNVSVSCNSGEIMTGGGCNASMDAFNSTIVTRSYPLNATTWTCNTGPGESPEVYAICCS